jgi:hypothetical protein
MKRNILLLAVAMTLIFITGTIYAGPPTLGSPFAAFVNTCVPDSLTMQEIKEFCELWAQDQPQYYEGAPVITTICPSQRGGGLRYTPNGLCFAICASTSTEIMCSMKSSH